MKQPTSWSHVTVLKVIGHDIVSGLVLLLTPPSWTLSRYMCGMRLYLCVCVQHDRVRFQADN